MSLIIYLLVGFISMLLLSVPRNKMYILKVWQILIINIFLVIFGTLGTLVMFYIENGFWGGTSFYGSVFMIPLVFIFIAMFMKIPYGKMMDFCAPLICIMLAVMKIRCVQEHCCQGRFIYMDKNGLAHLFPSQIVEAVTILIIMMILIIWERKKKFPNRIYPMFLILYGVTRFVLNFFRGGTVAYVWILPNGHFWSLIAIFIGCSVIFCIKRERK